MKFVNELRIRSGLPLHVQLSYEDMFTLRLNINLFEPILCKWNEAYNVCVAKLMLSQLIVISNRLFVSNVLLLY